MTQDAATATREAAAAAVEQAGPGTELVATEAQPITHRLTQAPAIDELNPRQLALLQAKSPNLSHAELAQALELAVAYQLDPFANEVWFVKGRGDRARLLIMVGRDGLRRIVQRNGLEMHGALVFSEDDFAVEYVDNEQDAREGEWQARGRMPFHRITHKRRGVGSQRGEIVGAWARVWERRTGIERGYFDAGFEEYDRSGSDSYSPWNKQKSAMMLGACERQAARQATPLGGLLIEGEDKLVEDNERAGDLTAGDPLAGVPRADEVHELIARARRLGHAGLADVATAEMTLRGANEERVGQWLEAGTAELDEMEPPEAEVVQEAAPTDAVEPADAEPVAEVADDDTVAGALQAMRDRAQAIRDELEGEDDEERRADLESELASVEDSISAAENPDQGTLI